MASRHPDRDLRAVCVQRYSRWPRTSAGKLGPFNYNRPNLSLNSIETARPQGPVSQLNKVKVSIVEVEVVGDQHRPRAHRNGVADHAVRELLKGAKASG